MLNREKAAEHLRQAAELVSKDRAATHGAVQGELCARLWSDYLGVQVTERDVWLLMALVKISRAKAGDASHTDHYVDGAAYVAMAGAVEALVSSGQVGQAPAGGYQGKNMSPEEVDRTWLRLEQARQEA